MDALTVFSDVHEQLAGWQGNEWILDIANLEHKWLSFWVLGHLVELNGDVVRCNADLSLLWLWQRLKARLDRGNGLVEEACFVSMNTAVQHEYESRH